MDPTAAKWIAIFILGFASFFLGMIPIKISKALKWTTHGCQRSPVSQLILSALLCFGAGVLLATALTHMLPEVRSKVEVLMEAPDASPFLKALPLTEVLLATGFFIVYGLDELVHSSLYRSQHQHSHEEHSEAPSALPSPPKAHSHSHSHCPPAGVVPQEPRPKAANSLIRNTSGLHHYGATECHSKHDADGNGGKSGYKVLAEEFETVAEIEKTVEVRSHGHGHSHQHDSHVHDQHQQEPLTATSGFLALVALSIHAVTEGLAIGLQSSTTNVFFLLTAVCSHKFVIAFCLGMEMSSGWGATRTTQKFHAIFMAVFSGMSALGILIGLLLMGSGEPDGLFIQALQALAAGTLLYVTFFEVLPRERAKCHAGLLQYVSVLTGFVLMLTLDTLVPHGEDESVLLNDVNSTIIQGGA